MKTDYTRVQNEVFKKIEDAKKLESFVKEMINTIENSNVEIETFLKPYGTDLSINNFYLIGSEILALQGHGKFTLKKEYKNLKVLASNLNARWVECVSQNIKAHFREFYIKGREVTFNVVLRG